MKKNISIKCILVLVSTFLFYTGCKIVINESKTDYVVNHKLQNVNDNDYTLKDSETLEGIAGELTAAESKNYTGFSVVPFIQKPIENKGTSLDIFYNRNNTTITFTDENGTVITSLTGRYGAAVTKPENPVKEGYVFNGWNLPVPDTFPAENITLKTIWKKAGDTQYKIEHYQQNPDNDEYTLVTSDIETKTGETDSFTSATAKEYTGFTAKTFEQKKINANGSTVIKIYYDRNIITFSFDTEGGNSISSLTGRYGAAVTKPENPVKEGYVFNGWNLPVPDTFPAENIDFVAKWKHDFTDISESDFDAYLATITPSEKILYIKIIDLNPNVYNLSVIMKKYPDLRIYLNLEDCIEVTVINSSTFVTVSSLWGLDLPESLISVYSGSFSNCINLTDIVLPLSLKKIGKNSFNTCATEINGIKYLNIANGKKWACGYTGSGIDAPVFVPECTGISDGCFSQNMLLNKIEIPDSITYIGDGAFHSCINLSEIEIPDSVNFIDNDAFVYCMNIESIKIPEGVTELNIGLFSQCSKLRTISLPSTLKVIKEYVFKDCSNLTEIIIPDSVTTIGEQAFYNCSSLKEIIIPDSVTTLDYQTFIRCSELEKVKLSSNLTKLENGLFKICSKLTEITIPAKIQFIAPTVFQSCDSLGTIIFESPDNWYYTTSEDNWKNKRIESSQAVNVSDPENAAVEFKINGSKYWFKAD